MRYLHIAPALLVLALGLHSLPARADDIPSWFVPEDKCASPKCTCDDIPMMQAFLDNQKNALSAWKSVKTDILSPTGPASTADAVKLFQSRFSGDPSIVTQFKTCSGYDPAMNNPNKIAGVTTFGSASLDPCFCNAFCKDIVDSTVAHEKMHVPTIIAGVVSKGDLLIGCSLGIAKGRLCDVVAPLTLANSELISYAAGINLLESALTKLRASDPANPDVECTWTPVGPTPSPQQSAIPSPRGFMARLKLIFTRILHGATPPESLAARDARGE